MRAYSRNQLMMSGICTDEYSMNEREGEFVGRLDIKVWGKGPYVLAFITLEDGDKIITAAWQRDGYRGIPEMPEGTMVKVTFKNSNTGVPYLQKIEKLEPGTTEEVGENGCP